MEASPFEEELIEASPSDAEVVEVVSPDAEVAGVQASEPSGHQPPTPPEPASDRMGDEGPGSAVSQWREVSDAEVHGAHWDDLRPKLSGLAALGIGAQRVIAALLFLGLAFVWSPIGPGGKKFYGTPEARPPAASASPGEASASLAPRLLPWPGMPQRRDQARGIVESLDARRWAALPWAERASMLRLISQMLGVRDLQAMKLVWQIGAGGEPVTGSDPHWPAASVSNARRAREAWLAHTMAAAHYPQLLATEGLAELEREIACAQVQVRWPGALGSDPPDAKAFAQWLEACLPSDREGTSVTVRLGSWPSWGVTEDEMEELTPSIPDNLVMPLFQDPGQSLDDLSVRVRDLAVLAATMRRPEMATLVAQLQVLLPRTSGGMSDDLLLEESAYRASVLAQRLSEAAGGSKQVLAEGGIADPPVDVTLPPGAGRRLRRLVAEHSRRVEVQLYRSVQAEPEGPAGER